MGGDTWQGRRQEFDAMARQILGRTSCRLSVDRSDLNTDVPLPSLIPAYPREVS